jgi:ubiquinone/menaquinone biosynthesis C-methylase UbiE
MQHNIDHHIDRVKFLMSQERKQQHNPQTILNEAGTTKGMTMADLGSGPGFFTIPMAQMTGEKGLVYAADSDQTMLNGLKENIAKSEVNPNIIKIINSDVCHTGIPKESVDLVLFANVLHEVENKKAFFQEVRRISKQQPTLSMLTGRKSKRNMDRRLKNDSRKRRPNGFLQRTVSRSLNKFT